MARKEKPLAAYLSDRWTLQDGLYFSDFRPGLRDILTTAQTPLTVGVFGPWGCGKTSLLRQLRDEIEAQQRPFLRAVWFTAWKYDRHDALWRAFILRVLDSLYPREEGPGPREERPRIPVEKLDSTQKDQVELLDRLQRSLYAPVEWEELGQWAFQWSQAGKELAKLPGYLLLLSAGADKVAEALGLTPDLAQLLQREVQNQRLEQLASMEQFEEGFRRALETVLGENGRLVVFVDDLDRCLPEKAVEVLEAIKLFLEVPGTVFVLGMDQEVICRGIEARYAACFRQEGKERSELPISGESYLQKIVQIPFHLPPLVVEELEEYIQTLEKDLPAESRLDETTRAVFAHGLYPNPRQAKRALNVFRLLQQVALQREERGSLPHEAVAWPLLAKAVLIQSQWPELYREWRQRYTLVQTLEAEYARRPSREEEIIRGLLPKAGEKEAAEKEAEAPPGGLLEPYLTRRREFALLEQMLTFPPEDQVGQGRLRARFGGLSKTEMGYYVRLAGAAGVAPAPAMEVPGDLLAELLSGDLARQQEAAAWLAEREPGRDGPLHAGLRQQLLGAMRDPARPARERAGAGNGLALLGDPRFRADAWFLLDEPLLGFVEIPEGEFLMGSDRERDPLAMNDELPQRKVTLPAYYIARYPVTVAQWRAFVEQSGHKPAHRDSLRGLDNHPVVWVTWREALRYCEWLTERLREWPHTPEPLATRLRKERWVITLPSEAQWEKAARGSDGRIFPWGDEPDPDRANYDETGIGGTSAVGCFPGGASPFGVEEMSGNVWEWCRTKWEDDYRDYRGDDDLSRDAYRVVRGGSCFDNRRRVRCAVRFGSDPDRLDRNQGFRPVAHR